jgi:DNA-binding CsgD family transcriptional regulator/tetratricopeptide (TPR) repeat protein
VPAALVRTQGEALLGAGVLAFYQEDYAQASALCEQSLDTFRRLDDKRQAAAALNGLALVSRAAGSYDAARAMHEESLALYRQLGDAVGIANALERLGIAVWLGGNRAARALLEESVARFRRLGDTLGEARALNGLAYVCWYEGNHADSQRLFEQTLATFRQWGDRQHVTRALHGLGYALTGRGQYAAARACFEEAAALLDELGDRWFVAACLEGLAGAAALGGYTQQSALLFGAAESLRQAIGAPTPPVIGDYQARNRALVRAALGDAAFDAARAEGRRLSPGQAIASLAQTPWPAATASPEASPGDEAGQRAYPPATAARPPRRAAGRDDLTDRELEVLRLVAQGLNDAEVAGRLYVSRRTVHAHLRSIYSKLDVPSRSAATRYAHEHRLV